ncbi:MAG: succinylglutamate desuccinylase/aspartoacylase family protein [Bdellovibrionota bacterium]
MGNVEQQKKLRETPRAELRSVPEELAVFDNYIRVLKEKYDTTALCPYAWKLSPKEFSKPNTNSYAIPAGKAIALAILGITHGNELAGLAVVNDFLAYLASGFIELEVPIAVALSNVEAARKNVRFLDKDLNRSFSNDDTETLEGKRAKQLELFLKDTYRLLDFHQTSKPGIEPFFIFPYTVDGFDFARCVDPHRCIVTHWGESFSTEGGCTDEYVNSNGGCGISYELGQNGFDPYQIALGVNSALWALQVVTADIKGVACSRRNYLSRVENRGKIYTWEKIVPFPKDGLPIFDYGWDNFTLVEKGEVLGTFEGGNSDGLFRSEATGRILFPKYIDKETKFTSRPTELYRILKEIKESDLPQV